LLEHAPRALARNDADADADAFMLVCRGCGLIKGAASFSNSQLKKRSQRRCGACVGNNVAADLRAEEPKVVEVAIRELTDIGPDMLQAVLGQLPWEEFYGGGTSEKRLWGIGECPLKTVCSSWRGAVRALMSDTSWLAANQTLQQLLGRNSGRSDQCRCSYVALRARIAAQPHEAHSRVNGWLPLHESVVEYEYVFNRQPLTAIAALVEGAPETVNAPLTRGGLLHGPYHKSSIDRERDDRACERPVRFWAEGCTPLYLVCQEEAGCPGKAGSDVIEIVALLLRSGASVTVHPSHGLPLLAMACRAANYQCVELLLAAGSADPDQSDRQSGTALHVSMRTCKLETSAMRCRMYEHGRLECAKLLLAARASTELTDGDNETPLHAAAYYRRADCMEILLAAGASPSARNAQGRTVAEYLQCKLERVGRSGKLEACLSALKDAMAQPARSSQVR